MTTTGDFYGLPTRILANEHLRLEVLAEAGPRIVRLIPNGSESNLLAEAPDFTVDTPDGPYHFRGGHRFWHAPEVMPRTYVRDDEGLTFEATPDGARLTGRVEALTGMRKQVEIRLHGDRPAVTLTHRMTNEGQWAVELAPWALTQMRLGGWAVLPLPGGLTNAPQFLPNRNISLWPYTRTTDARLHLLDDHVLLQGEAALPPCKIGAFSHVGWLEYLLDGVLFRKRFTPQAGKPHPDFNCNVEMYVNDFFLELETLGPLAQIAPGNTVEHVEEWEIVSGLGTAGSRDEVLKIIEAV